MVRSHTVVALTLELLVATLRLVSTLGRGATRRIHGAMRLLLIYHSLSCLLLLLAKLAMVLPLLVILLLLHVRMVVHASVRWWIAIVLRWVLMITAHVATWWRKPLLALTMRHWLLLRRVRTRRAARLPTHVCIASVRCGETVGWTVLLPHVLLVTHCVVHATAVVQSVLLVPAMTETAIVWLFLACVLHFKKVDTWLF